MKLIILSTFLLACCNQSVAAGWGDFAWLSQAEVSPEGLPLPLPPGMRGRVHSNGEFDLAGLPGASMDLCLLQVTQSNPAPLGWPGDPAPPCSGNFMASYPQVSWAIEDALALIRSSTDPLHRWPGEVDGDLLSTLIHFDGPVYHAAQYAESDIVAGDTLWTRPWMTQDLPQPPDAAPLIHIEGIGRIKGIVEGGITLLCADSLFLMGDLITADTDTTSCDDEQLFGMRPAASPYRIGLIGEGDVILAATLSNGFANGRFNPETLCGFEDSPVLSTCEQARRDVVITAGIIALGCSFEAEYWKTTASEVEPPLASPQIVACGGWNNTQTRLFPCDGLSGYSDERGRVWFHGLLAAASRGYLYRNPPGPWWGWIGYHEAFLRTDGDLQQESPPFWPEVEWLTADGSQELVLTCTLQPGAASACGTIVNTAGFLANWAFGDISLQLSHASLDSLPLPLNIRLLVDGACVDSLEAVLSPGELEIFLGFDPEPWVVQDARLWISASNELIEWNMEGERCSWVIDPAQDVGDPTLPDGIRLSRPVPNPFNPMTRVSVGISHATHCRLSIHDLSGREVQVLHHGPLMAGEWSFAIDGTGWPSGLYLLRLDAGDVTRTHKLMLLK